MELVKSVFFKYMYQPTRRTTNCGTIYILIKLTTREKLDYYYCQSSSKMIKWKICKDIKRQIQFTKLRCPAF